MSEYNPTPEELADAEIVKVEYMDGTNLVRNYYKSKSTGQKWYSLYKRIQEEETSSKCNRNCACGQSMITFKLINEKQIDVYRLGNKVGEIWSWKPSDHWFNNATLPYSEKQKAYSEGSGIQICGFQEISEIWTCGIFKGYKDLVVSFDNLQQKKE